MKKHICPLLKKPCIEHQCEWYITVRGYDVNTGKDVDNAQCVISVLPMLLIENSAQQRSTASAVESLRNDAISKSDITNKLLANVVIGASVSELPPVQTSSYIELAPAQQ